jgi:hypothetical protein
MLERGQAGKLWEDVPPQCPPAGPGPPGPRPPGPHWPPPGPQPSVGQGAAVSVDGILPSETSES